MASEGSAWSPYQELNAGDPVVKEPARTFGTGEECTFFIKYILHKRCIVL